MRNTLLFATLAIFLGLSFTLSSCDQSVPDDSVLDQAPDSQSEAMNLCPHGRGVSYVSRDADRCSVIRFICDPGEVAFSNDCGCGCIDPLAGPTLNNCNQVERNYDRELDRIQACNTAADCGQVLTGTSCGCTRNLVARNDANTARFDAIVDRAGDLGCDLGLISTCDCPAADGFACVDNTCTWNYTTRPVLTACGGILGTQCPAGLSCVDDPNDRCDPDCGGADCGGFCAEVEGSQCGGFAGFQCPTGYSCFDSVGDQCSPLCGGADCGGFCARYSTSGTVISTQ